MKRYLIALALVVWAVDLAGLGASPALAHGGSGTEQIANQDLGPVRIWVWSDPEPPRIGEYHVALALTESLPDDPNGFAGAPLLDLPVTVELTHLASGEVLTQAATHENATNKVFYVASFAPDRAGEWRVRILIQGADGALETQYTDVIEAAAFPWAAVVGGGAAVALLAAAVLLYRKGQPQEKSPRESDRS